MKASPKTNLMNKKNYLFRLPLTLLVFLLPLLTTAQEMRVKRTYPQRIRAIFFDLFV